MSMFFAILSLMAAAPDELPLAQTLSTPEARRQMSAFATCVADRSKRKASDTLLMDFHSAAYHASLAELAEVNRDCFRRGRMRSNPLLFAGGIAERLLEGTSEPLNVRLVRAAMKPAAPAFGPADAVALCVVRGDPDNVARLFHTDVASDAEIAALKGIDPAISACTAGRKLSFSGDGIRAMLATAAYRSVQPR